MLKAIHVQESKEAERRKAEDAAKKVEDSIEAILTYMDFPSHYCRKFALSTQMNG